MRNPGGETRDLTVAHDAMTRMVPPEDGGCRLCGRRWCKLAPNAFGNNVASGPVWGRLPPRPDRRSGGVSNIYTT